MNLSFYLSIILSVNVYIYIHIYILFCAFIDFSIWNIIVEHDHHCLYYSRCGSAAVHVMFKLRN